MALVAAIAATPASAVEEPAFKLVLRDGDFEVREYPALTVAEVVVPGAQREAANAGFRLLAGYIFGANEKRLPGPAPSTVTRPASETIAMTAPVKQVRQGEAWTVQFTMPRGYTLENLPQPKDPRVKLRVQAPSRMAVLRFKGVARPDRVAEETVALRAALEAHRLTPHGEVALAQYDPPWTPGFLRRNEVMIAVD